MREYFELAGDASEIDAGAPMLGRKTRGGTGGENEAIQPFEAAIAFVNSGTAANRSATRP